MTTTSVDSTDVSTLLAAADGTRTSLTIENGDSGTLYVRVGGSPATSAIGGYTFSRVYSASATLTPPESYQEIYGIWTNPGSGGATLTSVNVPISDGNGAVSTYGGLKTMIANWLRPGSTPSADMLARIPEYVGFAEVMIRRELHLRSLDQVVSELEIADGTAAVPTGFQAVLSLVNVDDPDNQITALALDQVRALARRTEVTKPSHYAISGGLFYFDFMGDATAELIHRRGVTPLSADGDTNWVLSAHPDVYTSASLVVGATRLIDPRLGEFKEWFARSLDSVQRLERNVHSDIILPMPNGMVA